MSMSKLVKICRRAMSMSKLAKTKADFVQNICAGKEYDSCINSPCLYASGDGCKHPEHPRNQSPWGSVATSHEQKEDPYETFKS